MIKVSTDGAAIARLVLVGTSICLVLFQTAVTASASETTATLRTISRKVSSVTTAGACSIETVADIRV